MKFIKSFPAIVTLSAAAICCVVSIFQGVSFHVFTLRLLCSVVIFLVIGSLAGMFLQEAFKVMNETADEAEAEESDESQENLTFNLEDDEDDDEEE